MRTRPTATLLIAFGLATGFAFALPDVDDRSTQVAGQRVDAAFPDWVAAAKPGSGPVFLVRGRVGSGVDAHAGYAWLSELEGFHLAWGGAVAGAQDVVFMIEAPDHARLDSLLASGPWANIPFTVEPLVRTKDRLARTEPARRAPSVTPTDAEPAGEAAANQAPVRPISDPNHGDGTTHPAP
jgi:hypothetical protein